MMKATKDNPSGTNPALSAVPVGARVVFGPDNVMATQAQKISRGRYLLPDGRIQVEFKPSKGAPVMTFIVPDTRQLDGWIAAGGTAETSHMQADKNKDIRLQDAARIAANVANATPESIQARVDRALSNALAGIVTRVAGPKVSQADFKKALAEVVKLAEAGDATADAINKQFMAAFLQNQKSAMQWLVDEMGTASAEEMDAEAADIEAMGDKK